MDHYAAGFGYFKGRNQVQSVVVFGSLVQPNRFHLSSDIDLAVWDNQGYFRGGSLLMDFYPEIEIDHFPIEDAPAYILEAITRERLEL